MGKGNSDNYDVLYTPEIDPSLKGRKHKCEQPTCGDIGSIVGCKECGKLWYFKYFPVRWYRWTEQWYFVSVKWYNFGLKRRLK